LEAGDEVLIPRPYWVSFPQQVLICGGRPVYVETRAEDGFVMSREALEAALTPRSKVLLLNSPANPTGAVYPRERLVELMQLAAERDLWVISDETYEALVYDGHQHVSPAAVSPEACNRTVVTCSFSKSYAMTGWRIGYLVGPPEVASAAGRLASHTTSNVNSIAQMAALEALTGPQEPMQAMKRAFAERRRVMVDRLRAIPGISCQEPLGAFYAFPNVESYLGREAGGIKLQDSAMLAQYLLDHAGVAVVPGSAFGAEGYLRLSYATGLEAIHRGMDRLAEALSALS
jgi:aspartate aminotransferase